MSKKMMWTSRWGKPEKIRIDSDTDDTGRWVESQTRVSTGDSLYMLIPSIELHTSKDSCEKAQLYSHRLEQEYSKVRRKVSKEVYGDSEPSSKTLKNSLKNLNKLFHI
jgi:hypothetical protein